MLDARSTPPSHDPERPVLDSASLDQLRQLDPSGGSGFVVRVLGAYERSLERHVDEVREAQSAGQWDALSRAAHTLKSASASVGARAFSGMCADIESHIREQTFDGLAPVLAGFFVEAARVRDAVRAELDAAGAPPLTDGHAPS